MDSSEVSTLDQAVPAVGALLSGLLAGGPVSPAGGQAGFVTQADGQASFGGPTEAGRSGLGLAGIGNESLVELADAGGPAGDAG